MKTISLALCLALAGLASAAPKAPEGKKDPRAVEWLRKVDDLWRGDSSKARMTMRVKTARYERSLTLQAWSLGTDYSLVRIAKPEKEKGTTTLKAKDTLYTYLPRTDRQIKLSGGMMGSSWMGSHFTNDDLMQESRMSRDFDATITFEGQRLGREVVELDLRPKPDAAVVWGRIVTVLDKKTLMPQRTVYYDEDGAEARVMEFFDLKAFGARELPARLRLTPSDKPKEYTELIYEEMDFHPEGISPAFFSLSRLRAK